jgi:hypothetical protein
MKTYLKDIVGENLEENFLEFDLTEIQEVLSKLQDTEAIDIAHAEILQLQALRGADILSEYLSKLIKTVGYLEAKLNSTKNNAALTYQEPNGGKVTADMRKYFSECAPEVEEVQIRLAKAKASKAAIEKKYDILIRTHHYYKDLSAGLRRTILGYSPSSMGKIPEGYE